MDYENKHKESLEIANEYHFDGAKQRIIDTIEYFLPEPKKSEDERIRKDIIKTIERHIEYVFQDESYAPDAKDFLIKELKGQIAWLEKQDEQTHTDKVEPKFKVGDWVVDNESKEVFNISKKLANTYEIIDIEGNDYHVPRYTLEEEYDLWAIQDAKDGDVLQLGEVTAIFKKYIGNENCICYCSFCEAGGFEIPIENGEDNVYGCYDDTTPATKEQRDLLFQKMKEACYEWDADKKELRKIEPKFKVGNWYQCTKDFFGKGVTFDKNTAYYCAKEGCLQCEYGCHIAIVKDLYDNFKLWTIQDAKDGDVVVDKSDGAIGIFQSIGHHPDGGSCNDPSYCFLHCRYDDGFFYADFEHGNTIDSDDLIPATKEQRNLLFQKMKEAGYVWDADKKELKKIEDKPLVIDEGKSEMDYCFTKMMNGEKVSSAWNEEDEEKLNQLHKLIVEKGHRDYEIDTDDETLWGKYAILDNWLKSLKDRVQPQWKPEDIHLEALRCVINGNNLDVIALKDLLEQLKRL